MPRWSAANTTTNFVYGDSVVVCHQRKEQQHDQLTFLLLAARVIIPRNTEAPEMLLARPRSRRVDMLVGRFGDDDGWIVLW
mmetsp:Transcript_18350/g.37905  ORF Transcript_18350/g.37905 Transcript_18350/m.37905 type:complete len:81 (+) Transcript_18350:820-1062(+)